MNVHPDPTDGSGRRYAQLRYEFLHWAEKWIAHFDVKTIALLQLNYVNLLDRNTVPKFFAPDGLSFALPEIVNIFTNFATQGEVMMPPFGCQVTLGYPEKKKRRSYGADR